MTSLANLKICFLAGTLGQGGAERQLFLHCRLLKQAGAEVHVLSLTQGSFWEKPIQNLGVPIHFVGQNSSKIGRILAIRRMLKKLRPQLCQSQHFYTNLYGYTASKGLGIIDVGAVRSNIHAEMNSRHRLICKWSLNNPTWILANSQQAIAAAPHYGRAISSIRYLPNIIQCDQFPSATHAVRKKYHILGVGRLVELKHWHIFLEVIAQLQGAGHPVQGILVGDGPQRGILEEKARDLGLDEDALQFAGAVADVKPFYATADLLLATSSLEGMPNVVMEAMACGLPVVSTRVGGIPDLIEHEIRGFLAEVDEMDRLREHCTMLLSHFALRRQMGHAGRAYVETHHSPQAVLKHLEMLYEELLA